MSPNHSTVECSFCSVRALSKIHENVRPKKRRFAQLHRGMCPLCHVAGTQQGDQMTQNLRDFQRFSYASWDFCEHATDEMSGGRMGFFCIGTWLRIFVEEFESTHIELLEER